MSSLRRPRNRRTRAYASFAATSSSPLRMVPVTPSSHAACARRKSDAGTCTVTFWSRSGETTVAADMPVGNLAVTHRARYVPAMTHPKADAVAARAKERFPATLERLAGYLRHPAISSDPAHAKDVRGLAAKIADWFRRTVPGG